MDVCICVIDHQVEQVEELYPSVFCECVCQYSCELLCSVDACDCDCKIRINPKLSQSTLCVLETCLIVGLFSFFIMIMASLFSTAYSNDSC